MTKENHIYNKVLADSSSGRLAKAKRGGNKSLIDACEKKHYSNDFLIKEGLRYYNRQKRINNINSKIMAKQNVLGTGLGLSVLRGVRSSMFDSFCGVLLNSLVSSSSDSCGVGRVSYAALVRAWRKDTANCVYELNEKKGVELLKADSSDSRVIKIGVDGHWSYFVSLGGSSAPADSDSDSVSVLVRGWLSSWLSWFDSVVCFGHYTENEGVFNTGSSADSILGRVRGLWSYRGRGGRAALSDSAKARNKAEKAVDALDADAALLLLARKLGLSVSALRALQAGAGSDDDSAADDNKEDDDKDNK